MGAGFLAGALSTLSPCVLPLLPLVIGAATTAKRSGALWLAGGVAASFTAAGLFIATVGFAIGLGGDVFRTASAVILVLVGITLLSGMVQARIGLAAGGLGEAVDRIIRRLALTSARGQFVVGALLGLVWSPCAGPTLGAASLLADQRKDLADVAAVMFAFGLGTMMPVLIVATLTRTSLLRWRQRLLDAGRLGKMAMGVGALSIGLLILTGADRGVEATLLRASPAWLTAITTRF